MSTTERVLSDAGQDEPGISSYRRLADIFHQVLAEQSLDALLDRIADALDELIPYDTLTIYEADHAERALVPIFARDEYAEQILASRGSFGAGLTGWVVEHREALLGNDAHLDPRTVQVPGTPTGPESVIIVPLIARGTVKGTLNIYREGAGAYFSGGEFELAKRFADAAALALDNAQIRARLERQAQTDPLTGVYNHRYFHERLRQQLAVVSRSRNPMALMLMDIDDFKKINDVYGHAVGDEVLADLAQILTRTVRASDVVCRVGGEEFAIIMPACDAADAMGLGTRLNDVLTDTGFGMVGRVTVSVGVAQAPEHAMNPRELVACAEAAMMTAKARGKNRIVLFDEGAGERPDAPRSRRHEDVRSIAHLKMLQSLAGKLNRLNDVRAIGDTIAKELRTLIDYHSCRIYLVDDDLLVPIAARGELVPHGEDRPEIPVMPVGTGITGHVAATGRSLLIDNALECEFAVTLPGTEDIEESAVVVPATYGSRVVGVIWLSKLGVGQFDADDVRLLEVLAGQASVALENARLYEAQRREAANAQALLDLADRLAHAASISQIYQQSVDRASLLLEAPQVSLWLLDAEGRSFRCAAHRGSVGTGTAGALIRMPVSVEAGRALLGHRREPFVLPEDRVLSMAGLDRDREGFCDVAIAPLLPAHGIEGWLAVGQPPDQRRFFTDDRLRLLAGIAYQASLAMQRLLLYRSQKENADIANALLELAMELSAAEGMDQVLERIVASAARLLGSPKTTVWLQEPEGGFVCRASWGYSGEERSRLAALRFPASMLEEGFDPESPFLLADPSPAIREVPGAAEAFGGLTYAIAPLRLDGNRHGSIVVGAPALGDYAFSERKMRLLAGIAYQARLAINNATSFESLEQTFLSTVEALANALEAKDEYTSSHARSITDMALDVGRRLGVSGADLKRLELGALFHDIGKIGIPSDILRKPGPLTPEERGVMEKHPEIGEMILAPIERLADVRPIVRHCHEHFDGSGYPDGLRGDGIPLAARIILVCDAFHAMTTDRPYRQRLPVEEARRRLRAGAGTQFDPVVVRAFLDMLAEDASLVATA